MRFGTPSGDGPDTAPFAHSARALRVAGVITGVVLTAFFALSAVLVTARHPGPAKLLAAAVLLLIILLLQLSHSFPQLLAGKIRPSLFTLTAQGLITYIPFAVFGSAWLGMPGFLAASTLLLLPVVASLPAFAVELVLTDLIEYRLHSGLVDIAHATVVTLLTGLVLFGLSRLTALVADVHRFRAELARLAVAQERMRIGRDLHDLLGFSLSAIALKCELAIRLTPHHPGRAQAELAEVLQTTRQAMADVRTVSRGYRDMSLEAEATAAEALLTSLGVHTLVHLDCGALPVAVDTVLATVLREGLSNVLRHSTARHLRIDAVRDGSTVRLTMVNDGVGRTGRSPRDRLPDGELPDGELPGCGLANLASRVREQGGRIAAGVRPDGRFALTAEIDLMALRRPVPDLGSRHPAGSLHLA